jgi:hypothetical protein
MKDENHWTAAALVLALVVGVLAAVVAVGEIAEDMARRGEVETMAAPGFIDHYEVTCPEYVTDGGPAAVIEAPSGNQVSYDCMVDDGVSNSAYFGDSAVTDTVYGAKKEAGEYNGGSVRREYCVSDETGGAKLHCRGVVPREP